MRKYVFFLVLLTCLAYHIYAHPVSFRGGVDTFFSSGPDLTVYGNYTFSHKHSIGFKFREITETNKNQFYYAQYNSRLYRKNMFDAQANIYLNSALAYRHERESFSPCFVLTADYENRTFFSMASLETMYPNETLFVNSKIKLGWAPYKHSYTGISTWFLVEYDYLNFTQSKALITPIYRGFYNSYMWEVKYSHEKIYINLMIHI